MIEFKDLDAGYEQCTGIYAIVTEDGTKFISELTSNIANLKEHWKGEDATTQINALIEINNTTIDFIKSTVEVLAGATEKIVQVQEARQSNGASSAMVGSRVSGDIDLTKLDEVPMTTEYFCDPTARNDYQKLLEVIGMLEDFSIKVNTNSATLMDNWISGNGREGAQERFDEFAESCVKNKATMDEAASHLDTAITNLEALM